MFVNLVLEQLYLDFIRLVGNFHVRVQAFLRLVQPLHQFIPVFMELKKDKGTNQARNVDVLKFFGFDGGKKRSKQIKM